MENLRTLYASGSEHDAVVVTTDAAFLGGRVPHVGQKMEYRDGRQYVFCSTALNVAAGEMVAVNEVSTAEIANGCTAAAAGAYTVEVDTTGVSMYGGAAGVIAANILAGGFLAITDDAGEGYVYKIKSHTAGTAAAKITFTLYDPLIVAVTTASDVCLSGNLFYSVKQCTATATPIGAAMVATTAATAGVLQYFWVQTRGPAAVTSTAGVTVGKPAAAGAAGVVADASAATDNVVGISLATTSNGQAFVYLTLNR